MPALKAKKLIRHAAWKPLGLPLGQGPGHLVMAKEQGGGKLLPLPFVTFREVAPHTFRVASAQAIPTWMVDSPRYRLIDVPRALAGRGLSPAQRAEYLRARRRIASYLDAYGAGRDGLVVR